MKQKILFYISLVISIYFTFLYLDHHLFKLNSIVLAVVRELLTIPMLIVQLFFLYLSIKIARRYRFRVSTYSFWAFLILSLSSILTIGSFYYQSCRRVLAPSLLSLACENRAVRRSL